MQRSNPNIFHVAKVHRICHGLVIHPLHRLAAGKEDEIKNNFVIGHLFQNQHNLRVTLYKDNHVKFMFKISFQYFRLDHVCKRSLS